MTKYCQSSGSLENPKIAHRHTKLYTEIRLKSWPVLSAGWGASIWV